MPSRCILNECKVSDQPDCIRNMTEVEVSLIAQNLQFRKIFRLPKSQWAQLRDRVICVPVPCKNIKNTITSLPRTPTESGLIGVNQGWKILKNFGWHGKNFGWTIFSVTSLGVKMNFSIGTIKTFPLFQPKFFSRSRKFSLFLVLIDTKRFKFAAPKAPGKF